MITINKTSDPSLYTRFYPIHINKYSFKISDKVDPILNRACGIILVVSRFPKKERDKPFGYHLLLHLNRRRTAKQLSGLRRGSFGYIVRGRGAGRERAFRDRREKHGVGVLRLLAGFTTGAEQHEGEQQQAANRCSASQHRIDTLMNPEHASPLCYTVMRWLDYTRTNAWSTASRISRGTGPASLIAGCTYAIIQVCF